MKFFGPLFDRAFARKLEEKFGQFDQPSFGGATYLGRKGRIISEELKAEPPKPDTRYGIIGCGPAAGVFRLYRTGRLSVTPIATKDLGPQVAATLESGTAQWASAYAGAIPVGAGMFVFLTEAQVTANAGSTVAMWLVNASPCVRYGMAPNAATRLMGISVPSMGFATPTPLFTGWIGAEAKKQQGCVVFFQRPVNVVTGPSGQTADFGVRVSCVHSLDFAGWTETALPAPALGDHARAKAPLMVCSKAGTLAGLVSFTAEGYAGATSTYLYVSPDNGASWSMAEVPEAVVSAYNLVYLRNDLCAASSGQYDVFVLPDGGVIRREADGGTSYVYTAGALPTILGASSAAGIRRLHHLGSGCFICFSGIKDVDGSRVVVHRTIDQGASWEAIDATGVSGMKPEYVGDVMVDRIYKDSADKGRAVLPVFTGGTGYALLSSNDAGDSWKALAKLPDAAAPVVGDIPYFGYNLWRMVDLGSWAKLRADGDNVDMLIGTDTSRAISLVGH